MKVMLMSLMVFGFLSSAGAVETTGEKAGATGKDVKRAVKKAGHRAAEIVCAKNDAKCLAEKAQHRGEEAADAVRDSVSEMKNKVDNDKK